MRHAAGAPTSLHQHWQPLSGRSKQAHSTARACSSLAQAERISALPSHSMPSRPGSSAGRCAARSTSGSESSRLQAGTGGRKGRERQRVQQAGGSRVVNWWVGGCSWPAVSQSEGGAHAKPTALEEGGWIMAAVLCPLTSARLSPPEPAQQELALERVGHAQRLAQRAHKAGHIKRVALRHYVLDQSVQEGGGVLHVGVGVAAPGRRARERGGGRRRGGQARGGGWLVPARGGRHPGPAQQRAPHLHSLNRASNTSGKTQRKVSRVDLATFHRLSIA